ncbi:HRDC domain-containing protein [Desulfobacula sp.]|jgi:ATP-dependent DNA helicase RecQ|uniref:HRDC domain-containing protein n=1 Tax=Desulfobacula sp. TaxID=2593537 RepID=UPI001DDDC049|nr:hypothetical protein [Desulfobacula sp.]MBT7630833.1 hypothetical protein [Desulfobacula sp.]
MGDLKDYATIKIPTDLYKSIRNHCDELGIRLVDFIEDNLEEGICKNEEKILEATKDTEEEIRKAKNEDRKIRKAKKTEVIDNLSDDSRELFELLKIIRMEFVKKENIPAYCIFQDATLIEMARGKPTTLNELLKIPGVGSKTFEKYGKQFFECLIDNYKE